VKAVALTRILLLGNEGTKKIFKSHLYLKLTKYYLKYVYEVFLLNGK
jgi:gamma-glutamylcysteine synthetase